MLRVAPATRAFSSSAMLPARVELLTLDLHHGVASGRFASKMPGAPTDAHAAAFAKSRRDTSLDIAFASTHEPAGLVIGYFYSNEGTEATCQLGRSVRVTLGCTGHGRIPSTGSLRRVQRRALVRPWRLSNE